MAREGHLCSITFLDAKHDEFMYRVAGQALLPAPVEHVALKCKDSESLSHEINFGNAFLNPLLVRARKVAAARAGQAQNVAQQVALQSSPCVCSVDVSSPFFVAPKQLKLAEKENVKSACSACMTFNPKGPG